MNPVKNQRVEVADVLRGLAVMAILCLHSVEHFNFYSFPNTLEQSAWLTFADRAIWDGLFFAFAGKAYAVFSLLFGFSFYIMDRNERERGRDFRLRFCWRLLLLFVIGNLNAAFFTAEVLVLYSLVGYVLPLVCRCKDRTVLVLAAICLLQPVDIVKMGIGLVNPEILSGRSLDAPFWSVTYRTQAGGTFWEMLKVNLWEGQLASLAWALGNGRVFQTAGLFMIGMVMGRRGWLMDTPANRKLWGYVFGVALLAFFPLYGLANMKTGLETMPVVNRSFLLIVGSLHKFSFMLVEVTGVLFVFYSTRLQQVLRKLVPYGRMSLTNYIMQSVVGSFLFYHWGLSLHDDLGITASFGVGICLFVLQLAFCRWWLKSHRHGPMEYIWKRATWIGMKHS